MTIRREMLAASRASLALLGEEGRQIVGRYFQQHQNADGGFADPAGRSDLYYTVFAVEGLSALNMPFDTAALRNYLTTFGCGENLDFVHLCCLVRAWASLQLNCGLRIADCGLNDSNKNTDKMPMPRSSMEFVPPSTRSVGGAIVGATTDQCENHVAQPPSAVQSFDTANPRQHSRGRLCYMAPLAEGLLIQLHRHRCDDGGFSHFGRAAVGTAYGCFLALGAYQELAETNAAADMLRCLQSLHAADGAYANEPAQAVGMTSATAAACIVLGQLNQPSPSGVADWLLARREQGGFLASPSAAIPDLLSTATALHALAGMGTPTATMAESVSEFVTSLLCEDGGFRGNWLEHNSDCEYTFYAILALGSVAAAGFPYIQK